MVERRQRPAEDDPARGAAIVARDVAKDYGDGVGLRGLDLLVPRGRIFGLVGPSGAGKTTAVRLILGVFPQDSGELTVLGRSPSEFTGRDRRRLGYMPQLNVLYPDLSLRHNLQFVASLYGLPWRGRVLPLGPAGRRARRRIEEVLELVDLHDQRRARLRQASGGEQRRLALAAALVHAPELLVLDEPTAGMDPVLRRRLWQRFTALRDEGRTLFVTTQYVSEAEQCDVVGLIVDGGMIHVDSPPALRREAFGGELVDLQLARAHTERELSALTTIAGVVSVHERVGPWHARLVTWSAEEVIPEIVRWCEDRGYDVVSIAPHHPSFDDAFVALVERHRNGGAPSLAAADTSHTADVSAGA